MLLTTKLKLATLLPMSAILAACSSLPGYGNHQGNANTMPGNSPHMNSAMVRDAFSCQDDARIYAQYSPTGEQVMLSATVPEVRWVNQPVTLNIAPSASGARYLNTASPNVTHEWQAKGNDGILTINWATGEEYSVTCNKIANTAM